MSGILYREYKESRQRTVVFLTVLPPKDWSWIVSRFLVGCTTYKPTDIDLSRDTNLGITCNEVTITLPMDRRSRDQIITTIFGIEFLNTYLPITDKNKMGNTGGVFIRMGSVANPAGPPSGDEEYALYNILMKRGAQQNRRQWECVKEFDKHGIIDAIGSGIVADMDTVRSQAKKHGIEGGSWLLHPMDRTMEQKPISATEKSKMCMKAFYTIVGAFLEGSLRDGDVTRVTYTPVKGVIKVFNPKSEYFEISGRTPRLPVKQIYAADIQVNQAYMKLSQLNLTYMRLKYKPEIFTVWKLNAHNTQGYLTLYGDLELPHAMKMEIAQKCMPKPPSHPPAT